MDNLFYYDIELRDKKGNLYKNAKGQKLASRTFQFTDKTDVNFVHFVCQCTADNYKAICKEGTQINIEVRTYNKISKSYPVAFSYYSNENRFIKH